MAGQRTGKSPGRPPVPLTPELLTKALQALQDCVNHKGEVERSAKSVVRTVIDSPSVADAIVGKLSALGFLNASGGWYRVMLGVSEITQEDLDGTVQERRRRRVHFIEGCAYDPRVAFTENVLRAYRALQAAAESRLLDSYDYQELVDLILTLMSDGSDESFVELFLTLRALFEIEVLEFFSDAKITAELDHSIEEIEQRLEKKGITSVLDVLNSRQGHELRRRLSEATAPLAEAEATEVRLQEELRKKDVIIRHLKSVVNLVLPD